MPAPQPYIVGRQSEVAQFAALVEGRTPHWLLNLYGPGGIGKTIVCDKLTAYAYQTRVPFAFVDGNLLGLTPSRMLYAIKEGLSKSEALGDVFDEFEREFQDFLIVQEILQRGGGVVTLFDVAGNIRNPEGFKELLASLSYPIDQHLERTIHNRFAIERYLRGVEKNLTSQLSQGLEAALERANGALALLVDTYEGMDDLDDWVCRIFAPALPKGIKVVIFGRNALTKGNFDWGEFGEEVHPMELPELAEGDAKAYLAYHGLQDEGALDQVYRFTGGYPLLLVLTVHLAREVGGWTNIGALESLADRDRVATKLLERILEEERAREVRAFLEQGVVARWFDPETIAVILEIGLPEARTIYSKLDRHSFVERHPNGLKFHDKIRELLVERLTFTSRSEYDRIVKRLTDYYAGKAGLSTNTATTAVLPETSAPAQAKYIVHIHSGTSVAIGDDSSSSYSSPPDDSNQTPED